VCVCVCVCVCLCVCESVCVPSQEVRDVTLRYRKVDSPSCGDARSAVSKFGGK
jgi:DsbC/DsbD-like thiol-disulfide interchange protein